MSAVAERGRPWDVGGMAAAIGLGIGVALIVTRVVGGEGRPPSAWLEDAALAVVLLAPLGLAVAARAFEPGLRAGVWMATGLLITSLGVMTLISVGVVFLAIGVLLFIGGVRVQRGGTAPFVPAFMSAAVVVAAGVIAPVASLFLFSPTPACWELRSQGEAQVWRQVPARGGAVNQAYGSPGVVGTCSSDTVTPVEGGLAVGTWVAASAGLVVWNRRRAAA